jgi:hypothetical protein
MAGSLSPANREGRTRECGAGDRLKNLTKGIDQKNILLQSNSAKTVSRAEQYPRLFNLEPAQRLNVVRT